MKNKGPIATNLDAYEWVTLIAFTQRRDQISVEVTSTLKAGLEVNILALTGDANTFPDVMWLTRHGDSDLWTVDGWGGDLAVPEFKANTLVNLLAEIDAAFPGGKAD